VDFYENLGILVQITHKIDEFSHFLEEMTHKMGKYE